LAAAGDFVGGGGSAGELLHTPEHSESVKTRKSKSEASTPESGAGGFHAHKTESYKVRGTHAAKTESLEVITNKPRSASARAESPEGVNKPRSASKIEESGHKRSASNKDIPDTHKPRNSATKGSKTKNEEEKTEEPIYMPWLLSELTEEKREKILLFRNGPAAEYISPEDNDLQIVRWLVARKWDLTESSNMFIESKKWRKTENMDSISEWIKNIKPFKFLSDYWPISILPEKNAPKIRTHDGYLVIYERLTEMHPDILDIIALDDMVKFHLYIQELCSKELRRLINEEKSDTYAGIVYVYDLSSLTLSHLSRANYHMFQVFNSFDANNYPETLRRVFLINAPSIFTMCWKVAKKFLDPVTIKKIVILGNDYLQELLTIIPAESIPKAYGGTLDFLPPGGGSIKGIKKFSS